MSYELVIITGLISGVCGFLAGLKKLRSNCCCISLEIERDTQNNNSINAVSIRRKSRRNRVVEGSL
jgi:hypothetical protein